MRRKEYKKGDRIFYECYDGSIGTDIVLKVEDRQNVYTDGKIEYFHVLYTSPYTMIEDYNCLPMNDPRVKELIKKYRKFDKEKDELINKMVVLLSPYEKTVQEEAITLLKVKLGIED